ncbi:MAG: CARDB domain-containing protein [archaeon]
MKIGKVVSLIILLGLLAVTSFLLYDALSIKFATPIEFATNYTPSANIDEISYQSNLQFYTNMRFNHMPITYLIHNGCSSRKLDNIHSAFDFIENNIDSINFKEVSDAGDIDVYCGQEYLTGEDVFVAGEGGPVKIVNTSLFNVITKGKIVLYKESCEYNVELHELLHVFGFEHSSNSRSIMYNTSSCDQEVTQDILNELDRLYSISELPDIYFSSIEAEKRGRLLNFEVEVKNQGLMDADNVVLQIFSDGKEIDSFELEKIDFGAGKVLKVENFKLPFTSNSVSFILDDDNLINELDESNNIVQMAV